MMARELRETPAAVRRLLSQSAEVIHEAGARLRALSPCVIVTIARGSSDHAAGIFKYAVETSAGIPVSSIGPSVASVYGARLSLDHGAAIAVSQSGRSPDLVALAEAARTGGAFTVAIVNEEGSPLEAVVETAIPIHAGREASVAATKSFIGSVVALLALLAEWRTDSALRAALERLPDQLSEALEANWSEAVAPLAAPGSLYCIGRGPGFAVAREAALKFKETCAMHAEAHSGAELMHGPVSLVRSGFPALMFLPDDAARESMARLSRELVAAGADLFCIGDGDLPGTLLASARTGHPLTEPLPMMLAFYALVEQIARRRGLDPDRPEGLRKVTETT